MRKILIGAAATAALAITALPAQAFHLTIGIDIACAGPAGLSNPHCVAPGGGGGGKKRAAKSSSSTTGKLVVGCIMGSALGAITASVRKASALGNPPRWRSQAEHERIVKSGYEKQFELTHKEAATALALCGLGSFALRWEQKKPMVRKQVVVTARY